MAYGDFKALIRRAVADKVLRNKTFHIAKNWKYNGSQRKPVSMAQMFFDKKIPELFLHTWFLQGNVHTPTLLTFIYETETSDK